MDTDFPKKLVLVWCLLQKPFLAQRHCCVSVRCQQAIAPNRTTILQKLQNELFAPITRVDSAS